MPNNQEQEEYFTPNSMTNSNNDHTIIDMPPVSSPSGSLSPASVIHILDFSSFNTSERFTLESPTISEGSISPEPAYRIIADSFSATTSSNTPANIAEVSSTREIQHNSIDGDYHNRDDEINPFGIEQQNFYQKKHCRRTSQHRKMRTSHILKEEGMDSIPGDLEPYLRNDSWGFIDDNLPTALLNDTTRNQQLLDNNAIVVQCMKI